MDAATATLWCTVMAMVMVLLMAALLNASGKVCWSIHPVVVVLAALAQIRPLAVTRHQARTGTPRRRGARPPPEAATAMDQQAAHEATRPLARTPTSLTCPCRGMAGCLPRLRHCRP